MTDELTQLKAVQERVGKLPGPRDLKVIDYMDKHAQRWIARSPLLFAGLGGTEGVAIGLAGGDPGFADASNPQRLRVPLDAFDEGVTPDSGQPFGSLFLLPGMNETLRVNGRISAVTDGWLEVRVDECYLHCAKALMRSAFWQPGDTPPAPQDESGFLAASRFMALATIDSEGRADLSPKGDPAGALLAEHRGAVWYPDRPGNRRIDSFRNILSRPAVALLALVPGSTQVVELSGTATITTDQSVSEGFAVQGRVPHLVTRISDWRATLRPSAALQRASLWPAGPPPADIDAAAIFKAHVKLNKSRGLAATLTRVATSVPGLMEKGLAHDYKNNLY
ncbi:pyridoxamine 5'-phosphate oxidase family protein [Parahaliea mediterranea]|uniref:pyridoxamine 5'-phosphate oxidase family protein n=1 Tax=Parahaliea mediterranea TaxID=651086 RepID=UPI000E2F403C|nr:pyridoxamine 5'-phosphate oxidase family protein [Parahaliea mediterranea]